MRCQKQSEVMATVLFQPPAPFCFSKLDEWPKWKRRFEPYCVASGLLEKSYECQASTFLYCLRAATCISDENRKKQDKVLEKFNEFSK